MRFFGIYALALSALGFARVSGAEEVIVQRRTETVYQRSIAVPPATFSRAWAEEYFRNELRRYSGTQVIVSSVFTDYEEGARYGAGKGRTDVDYATWQLLYKWMPPTGRAADMIALEGSAVMRFREAGGGVDHVVLAGRDPLRFEAQGQEFQIVEISFNEVPSWDRDAPGRLRTFVWVVTNGPLETSICEAAITMLQRRLSPAQLDASFRRDPWFIQDDGFPIVHPFINHSDPPGYREYRRSVTMVCSVTGRWGLKCSPFGPYEN